MRVPLLPPALLDLISVRASLRANNLHHVPATKCKNTLNGGTQIRQMQQAALATSDSQEYPPDTSQAVQNVFTRLVRAICLLLLACSFHWLSDGGYDGEEKVHCP